MLLLAFLLSLEVINDSSGLLGSDLLVSERGSIGHLSLYPPLLAYGRRTGSNVLLPSGSGRTLNLPPFFGVFSPSCP